MPFTFERFVALTAALAAAGSALHGCSSNSASNSPAITEGRPNDAGHGGEGPPTATGGAINGGTAWDAGAGGSSEGIGGHDMSAGGSWSGEGGVGGVGGESGARDLGGADAGMPGVSSSAGAGAGTEGGVAGASGGDGGAGSNDGTGGRRRTSTGGQPTSGGEGGTGQAGSGGEAGADNEACYGEIGNSPGCWTLPNDECPVVGWDPMMAACYQHEFTLHAKAEEELIACFSEIQIADQCGPEIEIAIDECIEEIAGGACPTDAATEACTTGLVLDGGGTLPSPVDNCTDGTLTTELCISALSVVATYALPDVARCADPTGEYMGTVTGTCAARVEECVFPNAPLYDWQ